MPCYKCNHLSFHTSSLGQCLNNQQGTWNLICLHLRSYPPNMHHILELWSLRSWYQRMDVRPSCPVLCQKLVAPTAFLPALPRKSRARSRSAPSLQWAIYLDRKWSKTLCLSDIFLSHHRLDWSSILKTSLYYHSYLLLAMLVEQHDLLE